VNIEDSSLPASSLIDLPTSGLVIFLKVVPGFQGLGSGDHRPETASARSAETQAGVVYYELIAAQAVPTAISYGDR